jgi:hypothetical protein
MAFLSDFFEAFGEQRRRLRKFAAEPRASLIEFTLFSSWVLAAVGPITAPFGYRAAPWGPLLPVLFLIAAGVIYARAYRPVQGQDGEAEEAGRKSYDRGVLIAAIATALLSVATFWWAMRMGQEPPDFLPEAYEAPLGYDVEIVK